MWTKGSPLLMVRLRLRITGKPRLRLFLPLALYVPRNLLLAWEGLFSLLPGELGKWLRRASNTLQRVLLALLASRPQTIADIDVSDGRQQMRVAVRTWGLGGEEA